MKFGIIRCLVMPGPDPASMMKEDCGSKAAMTGVGE